MSYIDELKEKQTIFLFLLLVIISLYAWMKYTANLDLKIAYNGFSPYEWITIKNNPYIIDIGYPTGSEIYNSSFFFKIYELADDFGFDILGTMKAVVAFGLIITLIAVFIFSYVVFFDLSLWQKNFIVFTVYLYFIASYAFFPEISRFGSSYGTGLYYNAADALRLIAIALFFKRRFLLSSTVLSLSLFVHPVYGVIGALFLFFPFIITIKNDRSSWKIIGLSTALFVFAVLALYIHIQAAVTIPAKVPDEQWYFFALFGNYHWFPIEFGLFGEAHRERLLGFLTVSLLYLYVLSKKEKITAIDKQIFYGWIFLIGLTVIGLLVSWYKPAPFLTKLALTRASLLALEMSIFYIVYQLILNIFKTETPFFTKVVSLTLLVSPFLIKAPFPLYLVYILIIFDYIRSKKEEVNFFIKLTVAFSVLMVLLIIYFYTNQYIDIQWIKLANIDIKHSDNYLQYSGYDRYIGNITILFVLLGAILFFLIFKIIQSKRVKVLGLVLPVILLSFSYHYFINITPSQQYIAKLKAFKELQLWAKNNTSKNALFMIDSSMNYGWRAFSQRASFGTTREWLHVAWLYSGNKKLFEEGVKRFNELNIDIHSQRYKIQPWLKHYNIFIQDVRERFYSFGEEWFRSIAEKYGINYIVMQKQYMKRTLSFPVAYENHYFIVYKID